MYRALLKKLSYKRKQWRPPSKKKKERKKKPKPEEQEGTGLYFPQQITNRLRRVVSIHYPYCSGDQ
jgi:hypothetical protein